MSNQKRGRQCYRMETRFNWSIKRTSGSITMEFRVCVQPQTFDHTPSITSSIDRQHRNSQKAAAITNRKVWKNTTGKSLRQSFRHVDEILDGNLRDQFIVDAIQGEGWNFCQYECKRSDCQSCDRNPWWNQRRLQHCTSNDHVNMSQSTNDVIPTAGKITVLKLLPQTIKELEKLEKPWKKSRV